MKKILLFGLILFFILHSPLLADEDDIEIRLAQVADDWLGFLSIILGVEPYEIAVVGVNDGWIGYFEVIKDLDIIEPDEGEQEELVETYLFIIADTMEVAEELYDMMFADADISGAIDSLYNSLGYLLHSDNIDEEEMLLMYKQIAHSIWYLCDRWQIPILEQVF